MITLKLLNIDNFYGGGKAIEVAKGKYKMAESFKEGFMQIKRAYYEKGDN